MLKNALVLGTSHTQDYIDFMEVCADYNAVGEQRWVEYFCEKVNRSIIKRCSGSLSIETYAPRVLSVKENYDIALIEIPSCGRYEIWIERNTKSKKQMFTEEFWKDTNSYKHDLLYFGNGDLSLSDITLTKIKNVNTDANLYLQVNDFKSYMNVKALESDHTQHDRIYAEVCMLDGYFKSKNIVPIWFSWNFPTYGYDWTEINLVNSQCKNQSLEDHCNRILKWDMDSKEYVADGVHLNRKHWKTLVDMYFVEYTKRILVKVDQK